MTKEEKDLRDKFAKEYLEDYSAINSLLRMGYQHSYAEMYSLKFMSEPYTQKKIKELQDEISVGNDTNIHRKKVLSRLYMEAYNPENKDGVRVKALAEIAKVTGLLAPIKTEVTTKQETDLSKLTSEELICLEKLIKKVNVIN
jgi:uncharacterized protein with von Willebrand factor type A (vWA) domain